MKHTYVRMLPYDLLIMLGFVKVFKRKIYPYNEMTCHTFLSNEYRSLYSCSMSMEAFVLAIASFLLTLVNIVCIVLCALIVLRIKEVAPSGAGGEQQQSDKDRFFHDDMRRFRDYQKTIHNTQEVSEDSKSTPSVSFLFSDSAKRERRKQLFALASLHDLDMTNQNDLTLSNAEARDKVKQLYKTMVQFDQDAKRLDIAMKDKQPLPVSPSNHSRNIRNTRFLAVTDDGRSATEVDRALSTPAGASDRRSRRSRAQRPLASHMPLAQSNAL